VDISRRVRVSVAARHLFLIDEIFRGTNTTERVAAAAAVLAYLNHGDDMVIVATHDMEVLDLLGTSYVAHHFREEMSGGEVRFDYRIHDAQSSTRNAIALLDVMGYPAELVADACPALDWQERRAAVVAAKGVEGSAAQSTVGRAR